MTPGELAEALFDRSDFMLAKFASGHSYKATCEERVEMLQFAARYELARRERERQ